MSLVTQWKRCTALVLIPLFITALVSPQVLAQAPSAAAGVPAWPREFQSGSTTITMYQPQVESWRFRDLSGRAAVSLKDAASPQETGVAFVAVASTAASAGEAGGS